MRATKIKNGRFYVLIFFRASSKFQVKHNENPIEKM